MVEVVQELVCVADVVLFQQVCRIHQTNALRECDGDGQGTVQRLADQFAQNGLIRHIRTQLVVAGLDVLVLVAHAGNKDKEIRLGNDVRLLERLGDLLHACALGDGDDLGGTVTVDAQQVSAVDDQRTGQQDRHADDDDNHNEGADDPVLFPLFPGTLCRCTGIVIIMYRLRVKGFAFALQVGVQGIVLDGAPGCGFAAGEHFPLRTVKQGGLGVAVRLRLSVCRLRCLCCRLGCSRLALPGRSRFRCGTLCRLGCSRRRCRGRLPWCSSVFLCSRFPQNVVQQLVTVKVFVIHSIPPEIFP